MNKLKVTSIAFEYKEMIPTKYTCDGANVNPPLEIEGIPENAESLVLIVDDPDAPAGTWTHWVVFNITPTKIIAENSVPGLQAMNDFKKADYGGPCPPGGTHRYYFKVFALDIKLNKSAGCSRKEVENAINGHVLAQGELIGKYSRK